MRPKYKAKTRQRYAVGHFIPMKDQEKQIRTATNDDVQH